MARFTSLLIHVVEIFNPTTGSTDRRGNDVYADGSGTASIARVQLQTPGNAREIDDAKRDVRLTTYKVFLPRDTDVRSTSKITWEGHSHRVVGEPSVVDGRTGPHHVELVMERIEGA